MTAAAQVGIGHLEIEEGHPANAESPCREAIAEFQSEKDAQDEIVARAVLARALLDQGKTVEAQKEVENGRKLAVGSQNRSSRLKIALMAARTRAALGDSAGAEMILKSALDEATNFGFVTYQFEARLAIGEVEMKSGRTAAGRARLAALGKDATAKGFTLIAQKASRAMS
jgi:hypothetical protein